ncbi:hypothetical protein GW17_00057850 [Ensete ventricosum]|nr:hypothetical protein GW17_00057850 [Ensete ventricosum]
MLTTRRGQRISTSNGVPRGRRSGSSRVRQAAGSGEGWMRLLATVGQGCDKMRRAQLEATAAARGDGCRGKKMRRAQLEARVEQ